MFNLDRSQNKILFPFWVASQLSYDIGFKGRLEMGTMQSGGSIIVLGDILKLFREGY